MAGIIDKVTLNRTDRITVAIDEDRVRLDPGEVIKSGVVEAYSLVPSMSGRVTEYTIPKSITDDVFVKIDKLREDLLSEVNNREILTISRANYTSDWLTLQQTFESLDAVYINSEQLDATVGGLDLTNYEIGRQPILDSSGNPVLDQFGNPTYATYATLQEIHDSVVRVDTAQSKFTSEVQAYASTTLSYIDHMIELESVLDGSSAGAVQRLNTKVGVTETGELTGIGLLADVAALQGQIDGAVMTWFESDSPIDVTTRAPLAVEEPYALWLPIISTSAPTITGDEEEQRCYAQTLNDVAINWYQFISGVWASITEEEYATAQYTLRSLHTGDTYVEYALSESSQTHCESVGGIWTGTCDIVGQKVYLNSYRFAQSVVDDDTDTGGFGWFRITDSIAADALSKALLAQSTADGKRAVFTVKPVINGKYKQDVELGDLWILESDEIYPGYKKGDLLACKNVRTTIDTYSDNDWEIATRYREDIDNVSDGLVEAVNNITDLKSIQDGEIVIYYNENALDDFDPETGIDDLGGLGTIADPEENLDFGNIGEAVTVYVNNGSIYSEELQYGDYWLDVDAEIDANGYYPVYMWNDVEWAISYNAVAKGISDTYRAKLYSNDILSIADGKMVVFYQDEKPNNADIGDLWVDTDDLNITYIWDGNSWADTNNRVANDAFDIAQAVTENLAIEAAKLVGLEETNDGVIVTFYTSDGEPTTMSYGDWLVHNTDSNGDAIDYPTQVDRYEDNNGKNVGTLSWVNKPNSLFAKSLVQAYDAKNVADGKTVVYYKTSAEIDDISTSTFDTGDMWVNTVNDVTKVWNGSWQDTSNTRAEEARAMAYGIESGVVDLVQAKIGDRLITDVVKDEIDGKVNIYSGTTAPSDTNPSDKLTDGTTTAIGTGDIYIHLNADVTLTSNKVLKKDIAYVATVTNNTVSWTQTTVTEDLIALGDLADGKRTIFTGVTPPTTTTEENDLWIPSAAPAWVSGTTYQADTIVYVVLTNLNYKRNTITSDLTKLPPTDEGWVEYEYVVGELYQRVNYSWVKATRYAADIDDISDGLISALNNITDLQTIADGEIIIYFYDKPLEDIDPAETIDYDNLSVATATVDNGLIADLSIEETINNGSIFAEELQYGDYWLDTISDPGADGYYDVYMWNGTNWVLNLSAISKGISDTYRAKLYANNIKAIADGKIKVWYEDEAPTSEEVGGIDAIGDIWVDTDDLNITYVWSGSEWVDTNNRVANDAYEKALSVEQELGQEALRLDGLEETNDGVVVTTYGTESSANYPTSGSIPPVSYGDWHVVTNDTGTIVMSVERYEGTSGKNIGTLTWVDRSTTLYGKALIAAYNAEYVADGKVQTLYSATAPTIITNPDLGDGDMWVPTANTEVEPATDPVTYLYKIGEVYIWSGSAWSKMYAAGNAEDLDKYKDAVVYSIDILSKQRDGLIRTYKGIDNYMSSLTGLDDGDVFINTTDKSVYYWNTDNWNLSDNSDELYKQYKDLDVNAFEDGLMTTYYSDYEIDASHTIETLRDALEGKAPVNVTNIDSEFGETLESTPNEPWNSTQKHNNIGNLWVIGYVYTYEDTEGEEQTKEVTITFRWSGSAWYELQDGVAFAASEDVTKLSAEVGAKAATSELTNQITAVGNNIKTTYGYGTTTTVGGVPYTASFGLVTNFTQVNGEYVPPVPSAATFSYLPEDLLGNAQDGYYSEFWVDANAFRFVDSSSKNSFPVFSADANGVTFNGKVSFTNVTGTENLANIENIPTTYKRASHTLQTIIPETALLLSPLLFTLTDSIAGDVYNIEITVETGDGNTIVIEDSTGADYISFVSTDLGEVITTRITLIEPNIYIKRAPSPGSISIIATKVIQEGSTWLNDTDVNNPQLNTYINGAWVENGTPGALTEDTVIDGINANTTTTIDGGRIDTNSLFVNDIYLNNAFHWNKTSYNDRSTVGMFMGEQNGEPRFALGNVHSYIEYDGTNIKIVNASFTDDSTGDLRPVYTMAGVYVYSIPAEALSAGSLNFHVGGAGGGGGAGGDGLRTVNTAYYQGLAGGISKIEVVTASNVVRYSLSASGGGAGGNAGQSNNATPGDNFNPTSSPIEFYGTGGTAGGDWPASANGGKGGTGAGGGGFHSDHDPDAEECTSATGGHEGQYNSFLNYTVVSATDIIRVTVGEGGKGGFVTGNSHYSSGDGGDGIVIIEVNQV